MLFDVLKRPKCDIFSEKDNYDRKADKNLKKRFKNFELVSAMYKRKYYVEVMVC